MKKLNRRYVFVSMNPENAVVQRHLADGGTAFTVSDGWLEERNANETLRFAPAAVFPATLDGTAEFQIFNLLAAIAACRSCDLPVDEIVDALMAFRMERDGSGRLNLFSVGDAYVLVDYGHNPAALEAVCRMLSKWDVSGVTGILTIPGDRTDALIEQFAHSAACGLSRVIVREDLDRRGRAPGEVAAILARVIRQDHPDVPVEIIEDELQAVESAIDRAQPGEVIAAFCDRVDDVVELVRRRGGEPLNDFERLTRGVGLRAS